MTVLITGLAVFVLETFMEENVVKEKNHTK